MVEIRRGYSGGAGGERLPWLEPVEDEYEPEPKGTGGLALLGLALLLVIGLGIGGFMAWRHWSAGHADLGEVIAAPVGPYKVRPRDPGGLKIDANGAVAEHTGTGGDIDAPLDLTALPEKPVTGPGSDMPEPVPPPVAAKPAVAPVAKPGAPPAAPVIAKPAPPPPAPIVRKPEPVLSGGGTIQLGALASEAKAKAVWKAMSGRFDFLAPLAMSITPVQVGENTLYRLRVSGTDARTACAKLRIAGEACTVVTQ